MGSGMVLGHADKLNVKAETFGNLDPPSPAKQTGLF
jgi:hypothetical protein